MTTGCAIRPLAEGERMDPQVAGSVQATMSDLTVLAARGQSAAIESLLAQIRPMVVRYCRARLGQVSGQHQVADDVAQEVCMAVLNALRV